MPDLSSIGENSLVPTMGTLNRCRLRHNRDGGTAVSGKAWKTVESGKPREEAWEETKRERPYIFDTRYLLHSYSGSPFMEPYFTRNWASTVHCVDHNRRIITAAEHWPSPSTFLAVPLPFASVFLSSPLFFLLLVQLTTSHDHFVRSLCGL